MLCLRFRDRTFPIVQRGRRAWRPQEHGRCERMRGRAAGGERLDVRGVLTIVALCMASAPLSAQLVITEDTVIAETVPGLSIENAATVVIAPGGTVEGDSGGGPAWDSNNQFLGWPTVIVGGGAIRGAIGEPFEGTVVIESGLVTGDINVHLQTVTMNGGVVLGDIAGGEAEVWFYGGYVAGSLYSDFAVEVSGGTVGGSI